jgi:hypothetical protein
MQNISIYSPEPAVRRILLEYIKSRNYRYIKVNDDSNEITAVKGSLFKRNKFHFRIIEVHSTITNIELKVNPHNSTPTLYDLKKEESVAEKLYAYF